MTTNQQTKSLTGARTLADACAAFAQTAVAPATELKEGGTKIGIEHV